MSYPHILITRPEPEAHALAMQLKAHGLAPIVSPAIEFEPHVAGIDFGSYWQPGKRRLAVFCSPRAVAFGLRQLPAGFLEGVELAAIGPASAGHLENAGLRPDIFPGPPYNSESLLAEPGISSDPGQALLFTAPGGRLLLYEGLQSLGWATTFAHVYTAVLLKVDVDIEQQLEKCRTLISVWTSSRALLHVAGSMAPGAWQKICQGTFLVTSDRLAGQVRELCDAKVVVARGPGNDDILAALLALDAG